MSDPKSADRAAAEVSKTRQAMQAARAVMETALDERATLLTLGFSTDHELCQELSKTVLLWCVHFMHLRNEWIKLREENNL
jgi:hypothetical protein